MDKKVEFFKQILDGNYPRKFQIEPIDYLYKGQPVILSAPTGSGKTWAAVFPYLYAKKNNVDFADRLFYVLPLRTLARSIYNNLKDKIAELDLQLRVSIQMGDQPEDPYFEADIIITTIDQLLSNYIGASLSTSIGQANIPPGAFLGSYIVFDEIHSVPEESLPTILDMVRRLKPFSRFLIMTATIPNTVISEMITRIGAKPIVATKGELQSAYAPRIPEQQIDYQKTLFWRNEQLDSEKILTLHLNQEGWRKTIVVINRVERAQQLLLYIAKLFKEKKLPDKIFLLHSRFLHQDRVKNEKEVIALLGNTKENKAHILVIATQVIEVGLDISSNILISELAPANALVQRAGRCARFRGEKGEIYIFNLPSKSNGSLDTSPYHKEEKDLVLRTERYLTANPIINMSLENQAIIVEEVHKELDLQKLQNVSEATIKSLVDESMYMGKYSYIPRLIRNIPNISLIIHDNPQQLDMTLVPKRFSLRTSTIRNYLSKQDTNAIKDKIWGYSWNDDRGDDEWIAINNPNELNSYSVIAIHPDYAYYDSQIGFKFYNQEEADSSFTQSPQFTSSYTLDKPKGYHPQYAYQKETYIEHIQAVRKYFQENSSTLHNAILNFSTYLSIPKEDLLQLVEMAIAFHDSGKLNYQIAEKYWNWQKRKGDNTDNQYLAHTDYDPTNQEDYMEWKKQKRLPHAVEGSVIVLPMITKKVELSVGSPDIARFLTNGIFSAIAKHHNSLTINLKSTGHINIDTKKTLAKTLKNLGFNGLPIDINSSWDNSFNVNKYLILPSQEEGWLWYWLVVRNVRLADQNSQINANVRR